MRRPPSLDAGTETAQDLIEDRGALLPGRCLVFGLCHVERAFIKRADQGMREGVTGCWTVADSLVGNDSGTGIAQVVAARHAERLGGLVLTAGDAFDNFAPKAFRPLIAAAARGRSPRCWRCSRPGRPGRCPPPTAG